MHSLNISDVQKETIRLLDDTQNALKEVLSSSYIVDGNESGQQQTLEQGFISRQRDILINEKQKAENLEMVIAVVGTMKAGKSTSINAMVGQEVLPNRALPMTALPTLVTHTPGQAEPVLYFKNTQPLIELSRQLISKLNRDNDGYAFLGSEAGKQLSAKLKRNNGFHFAGEYKGQKEIFEFLQELNDLMRMAKELGVEPPYAEYQSVENLPRIEVEFYHLKHSGANSYGRLTILDTPGPNEFGQSDALKKVFQMQLRQASAVLLVMDYTQLNSESDGALRQEVDSIKEHLGDRLFVLVNKFDNANKNTMNKEQTRHYVATKLLSKFPEEKVFPVSSWFGYLANRALNELDINGKINPQDDWVEDFGTEAFGRKWQSYVESPKDVASESKTLWNDSNFQDPLDKVIKEAHAKAAFEALGSSLDKVKNIAAELDKGVNGRLAGLETDIYTLKEIVNGIESDINNLIELESKFESSIGAAVTLIENKVNEKTEKSVAVATKELDKIFTQLDPMSDPEIDDIEEDPESESLDYEKLFSKMKRLISQLNVFSDRQLLSAECVKNADLSEIYVDAESMIHFTDREAATEFLSKIENVIKDVITKIDKDASIVLTKRVKKLQIMIDDLMDNHVTKVIEKAQEKLKDNGVSVVFNAPSFSISNNSTILCSGFTDHIEYKTELKIGSRVSDGVWARFKNTFNDDWGREEYSYEQVRFEVSIESIKESTKNIFDGYTHSLQESQSNFLKDDLNGQVKVHINNIMNYLDRYRGDLIKGLDDQKKNGDKKEQQKKELNELIPKLSKCLEDVDDQSKILNDISTKALSDIQPNLPNKACEIT